MRKSRREYVIRGKAAVGIHTDHNLFRGMLLANAPDQREFALDIYSSYFDLYASEALTQFLLEPVKHLLIRSHPYKAVDLYFAFPLDERGGEI